MYEFRLLLDVIAFRVKSSQISSKLRVVKTAGVIECK